MGIFNHKTHNLHMSEDETKSQPSSKSSENSSSSAHSDTASHKSTCGCGCGAHTKPIQEDVVEVKEEWDY